MSAPGLLERVRDAGITLWVDGKTLRYRSSAAAPTPDLLAEITAAKDELILLLRTLQNRDADLPAVVACPQRSLVPAAPGQQRLWLLDQMQPGNAAYNVAVGLRMRGPLDVAALETAINRVIARHGALRTRFSIVDGTLMQVVADELRIALDVVSLEETTSPEAQLGAELRAESSRGFSLDTGPLVRARLVRVGPDDHALALTLHHAVCDRWSLGIMTEEVMRFYAGSVRRNEPPRADRPLQYTDYSVWQNALAASPLYEAELTFWRRTLEGMSGVLDLPTDHLREAVQVYRGAREEFVVPAGLVRDIRAVCASSELSTFAVLLAGLNALLFRYSGQNDIAIGCPVSGRLRPELEHVVGFFLNTVVLRTQLSGQETCDTFIHHVRDVVMDAWDHQTVPFERVVQAVQPERDPSHSTLFQVMFVFHNERGILTELAGLRTDPIHIDNGTTMFDVTLSVAEDAQGGLSGFIRYNTELFEAATIRTMVDDLVGVVDHLIHHPHSQLSDLRLVSEEREQGNTARLAAPMDFVPLNLDDAAPTLDDYFERQARRHPDAVAVSSGSSSRSFREISAESDAVASAIRQWQTADAGRHGPQRIGVLLPQGGQFIGAILGVMKARHTYVPLDTTYPESRLREIVLDAGISLVLSDTDTRHPAEWLHRTGVPVLDVERLASPGAAVALPADASTPACLLYTSGSTGQPKGVTQSHGHVLNVVRNYVNTLSISPSDQIAVLGSFSHVAAMTDIYASLLSGAALHHYNVRVEGVDRFNDWIREKRITIYHSVPTLFRFLQSHLRDGAWPDTVRAIVLGGEQVFREDVQACRASARRAVLVNMYGSTEATVATMYIVDTSAEPPSSPLPVGFATGQNEIVLLNDSGVAVRVAGEIAIRNRHLPRGYWNMASPSRRDSFVSDRGGSILYRTGDFGRRLATGALVVSGRKDLQVKVRGFRVELGEVELRIQAHAGISEAAVGTWPDGRGGQRLGAVVAATKDVSRQELSTFLRMQLPAYMIPEGYRFVDRLPRTPNGKINRAALPEPSWEQDPGAALDAPRNATEMALKTLWEETLKSGDIGIHDRFFDRGGHSLLAVRMISHVKGTFGVDVSLPAFFGRPTIADMAEAIEAAKARGASHRREVRPLARRPRHAPEPRV